MLFHRYRRLVQLAASLVSLLLCATARAQVAPLSRVDAAAILQSMGYKDVKIAYIVQGLVPMMSTQNAAMVRGVGLFEGRPTRIDQQFFFDSDLGWFCTEDRKAGTGIRIWSISGYSEVALAPPPAPATAPDFKPPGTSEKTKVDQANEELDRVYQKLLAKIDPEKGKRLREQERAWIKFRDAEAERIAREGGAVGGSALRVDILKAQLKLIMERIVVLEDYLSNPDTIP